jgi:hypothetical protein
MGEIEILGAAVDDPAEFDFEPHPPMPINKASTQRDADFLDLMASSRGDGFFQNGVSRMLDWYARNQNLIPI